MKKIALFFLTALLSLNFFVANATIRTVSNRSDKPAQYTTVQAAITASALGDTILIAGSATAYGNDFTVDRKIIFMGEGMNNPDGQSTVISGYVYLSNVNNAFGSSGTNFYGISFTSYVNINGNFGGQSTGQNLITNVLFDRCAFSTYFTFNSQIYTNWTFRNCLFTSSCYLQFNSSTCNNVLITNSIFSRDGFVLYSNISMNGQVYIRNCNFMNHTGDLFNATGLVIENNIFFQAQPTGLSTSVFNNNLTYFNNNNTLPYGTNTVANNVLNSNPKFTNFPTTGGAFAWTQDFALLTGSPAIGTGTGATNIGITGGSAPVVHNLPGNSKLPVVTSITVPVSSVPVGGTLQINVKAKTRK